MRATVPPRAPTYTVGLALGQAQDFTALAVLEHTGPSTERGFDVRHLHRYPLGTPYPAIVDDVAALLHRAPLTGPSTKLALDMTGVGRPVADLFRVKPKPVRPATEPPPPPPIAARIHAITITSGNAVTRDGLDYGVPKRELVGTIQVLLQTGRLKIAPLLPEAETLRREMEHFQVKITEAGNDTYGVWREGQHDDLVLAVALAAWTGLHVSSGKVWSF